MSKNIFDLPNLIDWLERQDPNQRYSLWRKNTCLLGQYFASYGVLPSGPWYRAWCYGGVRLGRLHPLVRVVFGEPQTLGAALERAYTLQSRVTGQRRKRVRTALTASVQEAAAVSDRKNAAAERGDQVLPTRT